MVEKRRALQAKKQRLLKGLETLMRMAPDVVATRPGGGAADDWTESSHGLLQQGSRRYAHDTEFRCRTKESVVVRFCFAVERLGQESKDGMCRVGPVSCAQSCHAGERKA